MNPNENNEKNKGGLINLKLRNKKNENQREEVEKNKSEKNQMDVLLSQLKKQKAKIDTLSNNILKSANKQKVKKSSFNNEIFNQNSKINEKERNSFLNSLNLKTGYLPSQLAESKYMDDVNDNNFEDDIKFNQINIIDDNNNLINNNIINTDKKLNSNKPFFDNNNNNNNLFNNDERIKKELRESLRLKKEKDLELEKLKKEKEEYERIRLENLKEIEKREKETELKEKKIKEEEERLKREEEIFKKQKKEEEAKLKREKEEFERKKREEEETIKRKKEEEEIERKKREEEEKIKRKKELEDLERKKKEYEEQKKKDEYERRIREEKEKRQKEEEEKKRKKNEEIKKREDEERKRKEEEEKEKRRIIEENEEKNYEQENNEEELESISDEENQKNKKKENKIEKKEELKKEIELDNKRQNNFMNNNKKIKEEKIENLIENKDNENKEIKNKKKQKNKKVRLDDSDEIEIEELNSMSEKEEEEKKEDIKLKSIPKKKDNDSLNNIEQSIEDIKKEQEPKKLNNEINSLEPDKKLISEENKNKIKELKLKYEKQISNYSLEEIEKIDNIVNNVYSFDIDNPNLSDINNYNYITELDQNEKKLSEIIDDFNEKIVNPESNEIKSKRKKFFYEKKFFEGNKKINSSFTEFINGIDNYSPLTHLKEMEKLYKINPNIKEKLPKVDENTENNIFENNEIDDEINNPIGIIDNYQNFIYKFSLYENYEIMLKFQKHFSFWRRSLIDGNSLYRAFMFGLLEHYIVNNKLKELEQLINEILSSKFCELYEKKKIKIDLIKDIFSLIIEYVNNQKLKEAYRLLVKSYRLKNKMFDDTLIIYLKHIIQKAINQLYEYAELKEESKKYINIKNELCLLNGIEEFCIEPGIPIVMILPFLFDVNLNIFYIDGILRKNKNGIIFLSDEKNKEIPLIQIGYFFTGYFNLYKDPNEIILNEIYKHDKNIKQLTFKLKETKKCQICNNMTNHIVFLQKKFICCENCLNEHFELIIKNRAESLKKDSFFGIEYYSRKIHLQGKYYLDNEDIIELYENNLFDKIYFLLLLTCNNCKTKYEMGTKLFSLKCDCRYCEKCLQEKMNQSTKGFKILNIYETKTFPKIPCCCNKDFDPEDGIRFCEFDINQLMKETSFRFYQYINTKCMNCCEVIAELVKPDKPNEKMKVKSIQKYKVIPILKENDKYRGIKFYDINHLLCLKCYDPKTIIKQNIKNNNNDDNNNNNNNINEDEQTNKTQDKIIQNENLDKDKKKDDIEIVDKNKKINIYCNICFKNHIFNPENKEVNEGGCCNSCNIF